MQLLIHNYPQHDAKMISCRVISKLFSVEHLYFEDFLPLVTIPSLQSHGDFTELFSFLSDDLSAAAFQ